MAYQSDRSGCSHKIGTGASWSQKEWGYLRQIWHGDSHYLTVVGIRTVLPGDRPFKMARFWPSASGCVFCWNLGAELYCKQRAKILPSEHHVGGFWELGVAEAVQTDSGSREVACVALWADSGWIGQRFPDLQTRQPGEPQPLTSEEKLLANLLLEAPISSVVLEVRALQLLIASQAKRPTGNKNSGVCSSVWGQRVDKVREILFRDYENPPSLTQLGRLTGSSPHHLSRSFRRLTGQTISQFLQEVRIQKAKELLQTGQVNVSEAAVSVGYSSLSHFSRVFSKRFGLCPCHVALRSSGIRGRVNPCD